MSYKIDIKTANDIWVGFFDGAGTTDPVSITFSQRVIDPTNGNINIYRAIIPLNDKQQLTRGSSNTYDITSYIKQLPKFDESILKGIPDSVIIEKRNNFYGVVKDNGMTVIPIGIASSNNWKLESFRIYYQSPNGTQRTIIALTPNVILNKSNYYYYFPDPNSQAVL